MVTARPAAEPNVGGSLGVEPSTLKLGEIRPISWKYIDNKIEKLYKNIGDNIYENH
jgi:hypothetical protein